MMDKSDDIVIGGYEELYNQAPSGYFTTMRNGVIIHVNDTFLSMIGLSRDKVIRKLALRDLLSVGSKMYFETHFAPLLQLHGEVKEVNLELVKSDETRIPVLINAVQIKDKNDLQ